MPVTQIGKLKYVLKRVKENNGILLVAGDFFDRPRDWYLLPEIMTLLKMYNVDIYVVYGQHDTYMYNERTRYSTSLGILERAGLVKRLYANAYCFRNNELEVRIYGASYGDSIPRPKRKHGVTNILVAHKEVGHHPNVITESVDSFMRSHKGYDLIVMGDIHQFVYKIKARGNRQFINTGPMVRSHADLNMLEHTPCFFEYHTGTKGITIHEIPHKPADVVLSRDHIERKEENAGMLEELIDSLNEEREYSSLNITEVILQIIKEQIDSSLMRDKIREVISKMRDRL
jgi:DNA repair exonuclease SbcCD nuclease subunit